MKEFLIALSVTQEADVGCSAMFFKAWGLDTVLGSVPCLGFQGVALWLVCCGRDIFLKLDT